MKQRILRQISWIVLLGMLALVALIWLISDGFRAEVADLWDVLSSGDQPRIREYIKSFGARAPIASVFLMGLQGIFAPIPASVVQLANGVVFGIFWGTVLNWIGQMAGATAAFFISRWLGRSAAEKLVGRVDAHGVVEHFIDRWGVKALLLVRAIPGMPSDFVSYLLGLTSMPARKYLLVSAIGYIPQSLAYAWLGDYATDWFWWIVLAGFGVSFVIGGVVWLVRKFRPTPVTAALNIEPDGDVC